MQSQHVTWYPVKQKATECFRFQEITAAYIDYLKQGEMPIVSKEKVYSFFQKAFCGVVYSSFYSISWFSTFAVF